MCFGCREILWCRILEELYFFRVGGRGSRLYESLRSRRDGERSRQDGENRRSRRDEENFRSDYSEPRSRVSRPSSIPRSNIIRKDWKCPDVLAIYSMRYQNLIFVLILLIRPTTSDNNLSMVSKVLGSTRVRIRRYSGDKETLQNNRELEVLGFWLTLISFYWWEYPTHSTLKTLFLNKFSLVPFTPGYTFWRRFQLWSFVWIFFFR